MDERTKLCPINGLSVIVVDQDKHHANSTRSMLCQVNFQGKFLPSVWEMYKPWKKIPNKKIMLYAFFYMCET